MDIKEKVTKETADLVGIVVDTPKLLNNLYRCWWVNIRHNDNRSLRLTEEGYNQVSKCIKFYRVDLPNTIMFTNYTIVWMDKFIDCPYYVTNTTIFVSSEKMAVQLMLFSGDINKFGKAKDINRQTS